MASQNMHGGPFTTEQVEDVKMVLGMSYISFFANFWATVNERLPSLNTLIYFSIVYIGMVFLEV